MTRVAVVGAGIVGCATAYYLARDGHDVILVDRGGVGGGTTGRGEGNILISDKAPGPELALAQWSLELWRGLARELGSDELEWEPKGGVVVATADEAMDALTDFASRQAESGVTCRPIPRSELPDYEPHLASDLAGGVFYPDDQQVQPVRAAAAFAHHARLYGAVTRFGIDVGGLRTDSTGAVRALECRRGEDALTIDADIVVNAAGTWGGELSERLGAPVPVLPRRGFVLVTEPLTRVVRHKVYTADYVANVAAEAADLQTSLVIEGTRGGTVLIGASRERVGFSETVSYDVVRRLAAQATRVFPFLDHVSLMRVYRGFRPYCPDHVPVIGADARVPGVVHACGHEGAGIGLAPATGALIAAAISGHATPIDATPFSPQRVSLQRVSSQQIDSEVTVGG